MLATIMKNNLVIILFLTALAFSCRNAENEDQVKSMILGNWKVKLDNKSFPAADSYMLIEFMEGNKLQYIQWYGGSTKFEQIDTSNLNHNDYIYVSPDFEIFYEVNDFNLTFYTTSDNTAEQGFMRLYINFNNEFDILKLTNQKLVIEDDTEKWKFKKQ